MPTTSTAPGPLAADLRVVLGGVVRRLRAQHRFSISQAAVLGRLDREGPRTVSDLAAAERMRPQSMAQAVGDLLADGLLERRPDPGDGRRVLLELSPTGREVLEAERRKREGWLAEAIDRELDAAERATLREAVALLRRLADAPD
jgi:DNA-binding MarR family transcriptional regulator